MGVIRAKKDEILRRREMVARLRARRLTVRGIREAIVEAVDTTSGEKLFRPVTFQTIHNDLVIIRAEMDARSIDSMESWRSQELADIEEVEAAAWREKRLDLVLKAKERKHKMLGLDAPEKKEIRITPNIIEIIEHNDGGEKA